MQAIYLNHYLGDQDVANFARQSFARLAEEFTPEQNHSLIRFLARGMASGDWETLLTEMLGLNRNSISQEEAFVKAKALAVYLRNIPEHWVPFGHPHISLRVGAPVPIARQCFKHKVGFVESEESRRYISSTPTLFIPDFFREKAANVKQGSGGVHPLNEEWKALYINKCQDMIKTYELAIAAGVCPEQARFFLPQGCEVNWVWTGSLYAFANFYNQRMDSHAQAEIQDLAEQIGMILAELYPVSWAALTEGAY